LDSDAKLGIFPDLNYTLFGVFFFSPDDGGIGLYPNAVASILAGRNPPRNKGQHPHLILQMTKIVKEQMMIWIYHLIGPIDYHPKPEIRNQEYT
jgi:hypothetical protein